jgi:small conductance mechanosensitive channel
LGEAGRLAERFHRTHCEYPRLDRRRRSVLYFILAASIFVRHVLHRRGRRDLGHMLASFAYWAVLFLGFLIVLTIVLPSMHPADMFASLGIGSLAIGFALKDIFQNWIAAF